MPENNVMAIVATVLACDPKDLDEHSALGITAGWDSFAYLNILMALEKEYGIELNEETVNRYKVMSEIIKLDERDKHES